MDEIPTQPQSPVPPQPTQTPAQPQAQQPTQITNQPQKQQEKKKGGLIGRILLTILLVIVFLPTSIFTAIMLFSTAGQIGFVLVTASPQSGDFISWYFSMAVGLFIFTPILVTINTVLTLKAINFLKSANVQQRSIGWVLLLIVVLIVLFPFFLFKQSILIP